MENEGCPRKPCFPNAQPQQKLRNRARAPKVAIRAQFCALARRDGPIGCNRALARSMGYLTHLGVPRAR
eukprot:1314786-Pyramimonas_sp.AAC.1